MLKILVPIIALAAGGFYFYRRNHSSELEEETEPVYETVTIE